MCSSKASSKKAWPSILLIHIFFQSLGISQSNNPQPLHPDIQVQLLVDVENQSVRVEYDFSSGNLYYLRLNGDIYEVDPTNPGNTLVYTSQDHGISSAQGFAITYAGVFFLVGNIFQNNQSMGIIKKGVMSNGNRVWTTVAQTELYPLCACSYNHVFNGIAINPDGSFLFINSGSRTDHGEIQDNNGAFPGIRELPITSAILRIPSDGENITIPVDESGLQNSGYFYADGFRNSFDLAFAPNGDLFATENSGDRDDPEELNWVREGHHYGFPWRIGTNDTPQQFPGYDPDTDLLVNKTCCGYVAGIFHNDPTYPSPPIGVSFTDPVLNVGPDADRFRDPTDGSIKDASDLGLKIGTFTPHRSPLGLIFDSENVLTSEFKGDGFLLCWTNTGSPLLDSFNDPAEDLLHLNLTKIAAEGRYEAEVTRLVSGFSRPVDAVMVGNKIYVLEYGGSTMLWQITLPTDDQSPPLSSLTSLSNGTLTTTFQDINNITAMEIKSLTAGVSLTLNGTSVNLSQNNPFRPISPTKTINLSATGSPGDKIEAVITDIVGNRRTWVFEFFVNSTTAAHKGKKASLPEDH